MNLEPIIEAVQRAAILCREVQRHHIVENQKTGREPVTIADYGSQAIICEAVNRAFPGEAIMAEESGKQFKELVEPEQRHQISQVVSGVMGRTVLEDELTEWLDYGTKSDSDRIWVIDPIDGTKGFLALRHYVIAVGVLEAGQPTAAVMGAPAYPGFERGALLYTDKGSALMQPLMSSTEPTAIKVSQHTEPSAIRVLESVEKSHASHERMEKVRAEAGLVHAQLERVDSQEKYGRIAAGDGELYLRLPRKFSTRPHSTWDHACGAALIQAGGGIVTDVDGSPLDFTTGPTLANNQGMIVSNGYIHEKVLKAVEKVLSEETDD